VCCNISGSDSVIFLKKYSTTFNTATKAEKIKLKVIIKTNLLVYMQ